jgi:hypothetical protein
MVRFLTSTASHSWGIAPSDIKCDVASASVVMNCSMEVVMFGPVSEDFVVYRNMYINIFPDLAVLSVLCVAYRRMNLCINIETSPTLMWSFFECFVYGKKCIS